MRKLQSYNTKLKGTSQLCKEILMRASLTCVATPRDESWCDKTKDEGFLGKKGGNEGAVRDDVLEAGKFNE